MRCRVKCQHSIRRGLRGCRCPLPVAVNADGLATLVTPALTDFATHASVLMQVVVDDQDHTAAGCDSRPLGAMRYLVVANPQFIRQFFQKVVRVDSLSRAPKKRALLCQMVSAEGDVGAPKSKSNSDIVLLCEYPSPSF